MDRISASGTVEGVRKAWLARHRGDKRPPIPHHDWHMKSDEALHYISKDAHAAAEAMQSHGPSHLEQENKYRDQVNDAQSILHWRSKGGTRMPEVPHSAYQPNVAASDSASVLEKLDAKKQEMNEILDTVRRRFLGIEGKVTAAGTSEGVKKSWEHRKHAIAFHSNADKKWFLKKAKADESEYSHHGDASILTDSEELSDLAKNSPHTHSIATKHGTTYQHAGGSIVHPDYSKAKETALDFSKKAHDASKSIKDKSSSNEHHAAGNLHGEAAIAHRAAAFEEHKEGKSSAIKEHFNAAKEHDELAQSHYDKAAEKSKKGMIKVEHKGDIGYRMASIGADGKEYDVKTDSAWDKHHASDASAKASASDIMSRITAKGTSEGAEKGWQARKTGSGADFHIGNNVWVHRHGMDENGNHSVWVSKGPNERARKIQTNSNVPSMHGTGGHISHEAAKEIIAHVEKHF